MSNTTIWQATMKTPVAGEPRWGPNADYDLRGLVDQGRPLILVGRASGSDGRAGARSAAVDLHESAEALRNMYGLDILDVLPGVEELVEALMGSTNKVYSTTRSGRKFLNRFLLIDLRARGVVLSLSAGSAKKVDGANAQPHVDWIVRLLREMTPVAPAGFFAKRFNRISRVPWQTGKIIEELRSLEADLGSAWAADSEAKRWSLDPRHDMIHMFHGQQGQGDADELRAKNVRATLRKTGACMVEGRVGYSLAGGVPPGLFTYRDKLSRVNFLVLDSPDYYPARDSEAGHSIPDVRDSEGELVDQVETVKWFLREYARPETSVRDVFKGLMRRRFSTHALRMQRAQSASAYYGGPSNPVEAYGSDACASWTRSLLNNLDLYETGILYRRFGPEPEAEVTITGVFPASGSWGRPEDFARIRAKVGADRQRAAQYREWSWSGLPLTVDGRPGRLVPARWRAEGEPVTWRVALDDTHTGPDGTRTERFPLIPDTVLTGSLVEAVVRADGQPMVPFLDSVNVDDEEVALQVDFERLQAAAAASAKELVALEERVVLVDDLEDVPETLVQGLVKRFAATERERDELVKERDDVGRRLEEMRDHSVGLTAPGMARLISGLRNPHSNEVRTELRRGVRGLAVTTRRFTHRELRGVEAEVSGDLVFETESGPHAVRFSFQHSGGAASQVDDRALKAVAALRSGEVMRGTSPSAKFAARDALRLVGSDPRMCPIGACHDGQLLRVAMAALFPVAAPGENQSEVPSVADLAMDPEAVADFGDVTALAARVCSVYSGLKTQQWLSVAAGRYEVEALVRCATGTNGPTVNAEEVRAVRFMRMNLRRNGRDGRWMFPDNAWPTLAPCSHCGSTTCAPSRIREVTGYLCLECRHDEAGVSWPTRFDQYLSQIDLWRGSGQSLDLPAGFDASPSNFRGGTPSTAAKKRRRWRGVQNLSTVEAEGIVSAYADRERTVVGIIEEYAVAITVVYDLVDAAGVPRRRERRTRKRAWSTL